MKNFSREENVAMKKEKKLKKEEHVARQLGDFVGTFLEYDSTATLMVYRPIMCIRVRVNIRNPLKWRKKFALPNNSHVYAKFSYEKHTFFCFICGRLGRGERFFPLRILHPN
ncbi:hypothetical protein GQ457_02G028050 [Hibiscus cannabinus]